MFTRAHTFTQADTHRQTVTHTGTQTHSSTFPRRPSGTALTHAQPPTMSPVSPLGPSLLPTAPTPLTLVLTLMHPGSAMHQLLAGAGLGAGGKKKIHDSAAEEGCWGGARAREMTARGPLESRLMNINAAVIKMQGRSRMDAAPPERWGAGVLAGGWSPLFAVNADPAPGPRPGAGSWGESSVRPSEASKRPRPRPVASPPRPAPGRAARQATVSRSRPPPALAAGDVICTNFPLPGPSRGPESSPPPARPEPSVCAEPGPAGRA